MKSLGTARLVMILYTNWRGETGYRLIQPIRLEFNSNEWHTVPQWLMYAYDVDKTDYRWLAMEGIKEWDASIATPKTEIARLKKVIERLGSSEAFTISGVMDDETRARIEFARDAIKEDEIPF